MRERRHFATACVEKFFCSRQELSDAVPCWRTSLTKVLKGVKDVPNRQDKLRGTVGNEEDQLRLDLSREMCTHRGFDHAEHFRRRRVAAPPDWLKAGYARGRGSEGGDLCCRKGLRSKNDLDVKEIVNLWARKLRGVKSMLGTCWNKCANARDYLCLACRHAEPGWLCEFAEPGLSIRETGQASAGMSPVAGQARRRSAPDACARGEEIANTMAGAGWTARLPSADAGVPPRFPAPR